MFKTTFNVLAFGSTLAIASLPAANAMEFGSADAGNNNVFVTMQGKIVPGDAYCQEQCRHPAARQRHVCQRLLLAVRRWPAPPDGE